MPSPTYEMLQWDLGGEWVGYWVIYKRQGNSAVEIAKCMREEDARFILNAIGSPVAGTRIAKTLAKEARGNA